MDKKMLKNILGYVAVAMGVLAFLTMFLKAGGSDGEGFKGSEIVFGLKKGGVKILGFNILAFLAYVLPLLGGVVALVAGLMNKPVLNWVAAALFIVGVVLMCLMPTYWYMTAEGMIKEGLKAMDIEILIGGILTVVFSVLGAAACVAKNLIKE